jgi:uncharacterized membrane protein
MEDINNKIKSRSTLTIIGLIFHCIIWVVFLILTINTNKIVGKNDNINGNIIFLVLYFIGILVGLIVYRVTLKKSKEDPEKEYNTQPLFINSLIYFITGTGLISLLLIFFLYNIFFNSN